MLVSHSNIQLSWCENMKKHLVFYHLLRIKHFRKSDQIRSFLRISVTFTQEIYNWKLHFLCNGKCYVFWMLISLSKRPSFPNSFDLINPSHLSSLQLKKSLLISLDKPTRCHYNYLINYGIINFSIKFYL